MTHGNLKALEDAEETQLVVGYLYTLRCCHEFWPNESNQKNQKKKKAGPVGQTLLELKLLGAKSIATRGSWYGY